MADAARAGVSAAKLGRLYRAEGRHVYATLVRLLGDMGRAEEALHDAFLAAAEHWPSAGVPANPVAWLVSAGRFKAIDALRREHRFAPLDEAVHDVADSAPNWDAREPIEDDRLRLIFTCCHPALSEEARVALTLREVCGLTTEAIASAFLTPAPTLAQRIVRAKAKIRAAGIPYEVPAGAQLAERLPSVLRTVYLVFNAGYAGGSAAELMDEALRLARLLHTLQPQAETLGLLALMTLHHARRATRVDAAGALTPLHEQDRAQWDAAAIAEGARLAQAALSLPGHGAYALQAAIAALHAEAASVDATDWPQVVGLYDALLHRQPNPVVALNRAAAIAQWHGAEAGLALVDALCAEHPMLAAYLPAVTTRAELLHRLGRRDEARAAWQAALALNPDAPERRLIEQRLAALG